MRSSSYDILVWPVMVWYGLIRMFSLNIKFWYFHRWVGGGGGGANQK